MPVDYKRYPVLYVDDERGNLVTFRYAFGDDFNLLTTQNGEEALRLMQQHPVAVLLADQRMPGMTGSELCAQARHVRPETVRMIVTAYADVAATADAINRGQVSRYIMKPWREEEMATTLRTAIEFFELGQMVHQMEARMLSSERVATAVLVVQELAHELKNPLTAVRSSLSFLHDRIRASLAPAAPDAGSGGAGVPGAAAIPVEMFEAAGDGLAASRQIEEVLKRTIKAGRPSLAPSAPVDLGRLVESAVRICRGELRARAQVEIELKASPVVRADPTNVGQILVNLLLNAAQAIPEGAAERNRVAVSVNEGEGRARVEVRDTGGGILEENRERVWDPHFTTKPGQGSGLGLAIVRDLVNKCGGEIGFKTEVGVGTTFWVLFPTIL